MANDTGTAVFTILDQLGISDYVVPFIVVWTAMYAVLMKIKIVGDRADLNGIIAFGMTYLFVSVGGGKMVRAILPLFMIMFLILLIIMLLYKFMGAKDESIIKTITNPAVVLLMIMLIVLFTFIGLQDWLVFSDRIPSWKVSETGELLTEDQIGGAYPGNVTDIESKPHSIIVNEQEYELIEGIYYKNGYEGAAYAIGQPQVIGGIFILIILGVVTALVVWPKNS